MMRPVIMTPSSCGARFSSARAARTSGLREGGEDIAKANVEVNKWEFWRGYESLGKSFENDWKEMDNQRHEYFGNDNRGGSRWLEVARGEWNEEDLSIVRRVMACIWVASIKELAEKTKGSKMYFLPGEIRLPGNPTGRGWQRQSE
jgi:hypothetical protein